MIKVMYVYGFGGSRNSRTGQVLREILPQGEYEVVCVDYPQQDCAAAIEFLEEKVRELDIDIVMGSSLGGFIALCMDVSIPKLICNPCLKPTVELLKLENARGYEKEVATYAPFEEVALQSSEPMRVHGFFAPGDELLGDRYRATFEDHYPDVTDLPGTHRLSNEAIAIVADCIKDLA